MTLAAFYALIAAQPIRLRWRLARAAYQLGDLMFARGLTQGAAVTVVEARQTNLDALLLAGLKTQFESVNAP